MVLNIAVFLGLMRISTYLSLSICLSIYVTIYPSVLLSIYPLCPTYFSNDILLLLLLRRRRRWCLVVAHRFRFGDAGQANFAQVAILSGLFLEPHVPASRRNSTGRQHHKYARKHNFPNQSSGRRPNDNTWACVYHNISDQILTYYITARMHIYIYMYVCIHEHICIYTCGYK